MQRFTPSPFDLTGRKKRANRTTRLSKSKAGADEAISTLSGSLSLFLSGPLSLARDAMGEHHSSQRYTHRAMIRRYMVRTGYGSTHRKERRGFAFKRLRLSPSTQEPTSWSHLAAFKIRWLLSLSLSRSLARARGDRISRSLSPWTLPPRRRGFDDPSP